MREGESVYDFCWYPYMSASGLFATFLWRRILDIDSFIKNMLFAMSYGSLNYSVNDSVIKI